MKTTKNDLLQIIIYSIEILLVLLVRRLYRDGLIHNMLALAVTAVLIISARWASSLSNKLVDIIDTHVIKNKQCLCVMRFIVFAISTVLLFYVSVLYRQGGIGALEVFVIFFMMVVSTIGLLSWRLKEE